MKKYLVFSFITVQFIAQSLYALDPPGKFLGYEPGSRFTPHTQVMAYFDYIAGSASNVRLTEYGKTREGRPLIVAIVSSEKNMKNLETIRLNNLKRTGEVAGPADNDNIAIVWLSYNVHGNEPSSTETAMKVLYTLATKKSDWLENTVVIIDPCLNPDGRDRYVSWYSQTEAILPDPRIESAEHHELWPSGRFNHYLFDLNRDWAWLTQTESRSRIKLYHQWMPHVHVDFHEQGINNNYYFAPAAPPYHECITTWQKTFQEWVGENNARYFDKNGWLFFTRESFDLYYPGFGDTYPMFNGAIGMTYEVPGNTRGGLAVITELGDTLTLKDRIDRHFATSMATIEVCSQHADKLTWEFSKYFTDAKNSKDKDIYLIKNTSSYTTARLTDLLDRHHIKYSYCNKEERINGRDYITGTEITVTVEKNDLIVDPHQPASRLVHVLFNPHSLPSDSLTYDITAWSLPYAFGLKTYILRQKPGERTNMESTLVNAPAKLPVYAFLVHWKDMGSAGLLSELLSDGIKVRKAGKPISFKGETFREGSLIITKNDNHKLKKGWPDQIIKLISKHHIALNTIVTPSEIRKTNIGSRFNSLIAKPEVALAYGNGTYATGCGEIWYFFEQEIHYPVSRINSTDLVSMDLSKYDILIFPDGNYLTTRGEDGFKNIDQWVRNGGRLILLEGAVRSFTGKDKFSLKKAEDSHEANENLTGHTMYRDSDRDYLTHISQGCLIDIQLDHTHPLAYGYGDSYISLHSGQTLYETLKDGWNVGYTGKNTKVISGFAGKKFRRLLPDKLIFGVEEAGQGEVIYLLDNVLFRGFWENGKLMFANALFM